MTQPLTSFQRIKVVNTFKEVKSIRETSVLCKASRNTVRKVLRSMGLSNEVKNQMMAHGESCRVLSGIPKINEQCKWNPLNSNLYQSLHRLESNKLPEPWLVENLKNLAILMTSLANELQIGESVIGNVKLELLMRSYMDFCDSEAKANSFSTDFTISKEKQAKLRLMYKSASEKSLKFFLDILSELEGKSSLKNLNVQQNNININMP